MKMSWVFIIVFYYSVATMEKIISDDPDAVFMPFEMYSPYSLKSWPVYLTIFIWEYICLSYVNMTIWGFLTLVFLLHNHIEFEFEALIYALTNTRKRAKEIMKRSKKTFDLAERDKIYLKSVNQCIEHHTKLIDYFNRYKALSRLPSTCVLLTGISLTVFSGLAFVTGSMVVVCKFTAFITAQLIYIFIFNLLAEKITQFSIDLSTAAFFGTQWYTLPLSCQKSLRIMLMQKPLYSDNLVRGRMNLESFMDMIRTSYSYFNIIWQTQKPA